MTALLNDVSFAEQRWPLDLFAISSLVAFPQFVYRKFHEYEFKAN